ncbi:MAG: hypothetical protein U0M12_09520 [Acutalibacteraceae bacterium]|nr:hypothetical protein [Acutalibacteraceae bacterium]
MGESVFENALENAMKNNRIPHGVVLESKQPELIQKYSLTLSKWAVCKSSAKPCMQCAQCKKAESGNHPDIYTAQLSGKSEVVNVDEIRKICSDAYIKPNEADIKVYIIPNADKMQQQAQNAFLKILEEPPQNILFILCCTSSQTLLGTIRSRVTVYNLDKSGRNLSDDNTKKAFEKAQQIATAIPLSKGYKLLCAVGSVTDRNFAKTVMEQLLIIVNSAIKEKVLHNERDSAVQMLADKMDTVNLMNVINIITTAKIKLNSNINMNLFSAWFCAEIRRKK